VVRLAAPGERLVPSVFARATPFWPDRRRAGRALFALLLATLMFFGYAVAYVLTPLPLEWQIATSFERLMAQLWPTIVWTAFQLSGSGQQTWSLRRSTTA